ncbi:tryptophan 7-halogenase [Pseudoalteromonas umbrosa]|uniref:tryptophan 7-halogenase n=1 Tax=Pseudoalteromonas umbrosa TaxID=3048489 RepID=UPI0024C409C6|nr:tryptophan 7-halogenase [Pseudoalteromonas sp. B95]MDK1286286.1 tryptophan 7-halogenase [Pseudoalteromonas sp. B95]
MSDVLECDCLIIGGGITGTVAAKLLLDHGYNVVLVEESSSSKIRLAESLPASIEPLLARIGVFELLMSGPHVRHSGMVSSWGSPFLQTAPLVAAHHGWKVDKQFFIEQIRSTLPKQSTLLGRVKDARRVDQGWQCSINCANTQNKLVIKARFVLDTSGRQGYLPRVLNLQRHTFDKLSAFVTNSRLKAPLQNQPAVAVEAFEDGWTLASKINDEECMLAIFCNQFTPDFGKLKQCASWHSIAKNTHWFRKVLPQEPFDIKALNASSHIISKLHGDNWLIAGDAAMSFDPLSSHGMTTAIYMAEKSAQAIHKVFQGEQSALGNYSETMTQIYNSYLNELLGHYRREQRFTNSKFWQSKQQFSAPEVLKVVG